MTYQLKAIGKVKNDETGTFIQLEPEYIPGLQALKGFSHINVLWWFSDCDNDADRNELQTEQPYEGAPEVMGVFATRSNIFQDYFHSTGPYARFDASG